MLHIAESIELLQSPNQKNS